MSQNISSPLNNCWAFCNIPSGSRKKALQNISDKLQKSIPTLDASEIFENLIAREKLGSTSIGKGVALPHCRAKSVDNAIYCIVKLAEPIDFDAIDELPVDLLFVMIVPEQSTDEHLQVLNDLAKQFENSELRNSVRKSQNNQDLLVAIQQLSNSH